jgi:DNA-binding NarL/FixJ family response regulator
VTAVTDLPPIPPTGDAEADAELAKLREDTAAIWQKQEEVEALSRERMRTVLSLRRRGVLFRTIADAVPTTEQTVYKIHREARRAESEGAL